MIDFHLNPIAYLSNIDFETISSALRSADLPETDLVVGIGSGGVVFAAMTAFKLNVSLMILWLKYRGANNEPVHSDPILSQSFCLPNGIRRVLLVDDVVVSGKTMRVAKSILSDIKVTTLTLKGNADIVLFPEISSCVQWPWNPVQTVDDNLSNHA